MRSERKKTTRTSEKMEIREKKSPEPRPTRDPGRTRAQAARQWGELSLPLIWVSQFRIVVFGISEICLWVFWLVHDTSIFFFNFFGYKSSLRGSISRWLPRGKQMSHQMWLDHKNRVFKTRFIDQNRTSNTRDVSKKYNFETLTTN